MRVLLVSNMWPGPIKPHFGVFVERRVDGYRAAGAEVSVVANADPRRGPIRTLFKYGLLAMRALVIGFRGRPDVVEGHYLVPTAALAAAVSWMIRRPLVLYVHGSDLSARFPGVGWALRRASVIHTNSEHTANLITRLPEVRCPVAVFPPGVDLSVFRPPGVMPAEPLVLFVGDLLHHKGVDVLLRGLQGLDIDWRGRIVGGGPEEPDLRELAVELGIDDRITWDGPLSHASLPAVFGGAAVVVVPSRRDALGQVAVEALACGRPVIVTDVGGLASVPTPACGEVVEADEPQALTQAIRRWLPRRSDSEVQEAAVRRAADFDYLTVARAALESLASIVS